VVSSGDFFRSFDPVGKFSDTSPNMAVKERRRFSCGRSGERIFKFSDKCFSLRYSKRYAGVPFCGYIPSFGAGAFCHSTGDQGIPVGQRREVLQVSAVHAVYKVALSCSTID